MDLRASRNETASISYTNVVIYVVACFIATVKTVICDDLFLQECMRFGCHIHERPYPKQLQIVVVLVIGVMKMLFIELWHLIDYEHVYPQQVHQSLWMNGFPFGGSFLKSTREIEIMICLTNSYLP